MQLIITKSLITLHRSKQIFYQEVQNLLFCLLLFTSVIVEVRNPMVCFYKYMIMIYDLYCIYTSVKRLQRKGFIFWYAYSWDQARSVSWMDGRTDKQAAILTCSIPAHFHFHESWHLDFVQTEVSVYQDTKCEDIYRNLLDSTSEVGYLSTQFRCNIRYKTRSLSNIIFIIIIAYSQFHNGFGKYSRLLIHISIKQINTNRNETKQTTTNNSDARTLKHSN